MQWSQHEDDDRLLVPDSPNQKKEKMKISEFLLRTWYNVKCQVREASRDDSSDMSETEDSSLQCQGDSLVDCKRVKRSQ